MHSKLLFKVFQRIEAVRSIETPLIFPVTAFDFSVMPWRVRANQLVPYSQFFCRFLKKSGQIPFAVGKAIGEFKAIVSLNTLHMDTSASIPPCQLSKEVRRGTGGLFGVSSQEA